MICLSLTGNTRAHWSEMIVRNRRWVDLVELRIDMLKPAERSVDDLAAWWARQQDHGILPGIVTVRRNTELGLWEGDEAQRLHLLNRLVSAVRPDYIDIELDRSGLPDWDRLAATVQHDGGNVIRSHHEVRTTPNELASLMARLAAEPHEIPKLAVMPQSMRDTVRFVAAAREFGRMMPGRHGIWVAMGEFGLPSRAWPARTGSLLTFGSDPSGPAAAPGHISPEVLRTVYRVGEAKADWPAFAVIGSPIAHSQSPTYHNTRFREGGIGAIYIPIRLDSFEAFTEAVDAFGLRGVSVTVPHKAAAAAFASEKPHDGGDGGATPSTVSGNGADEAPFEGALTAEVTASGVANTLWRANGAWYADNTDIAAFRHALEEGFGAPLARVSVLVIGAGGAARGVVAALVGSAAEITIVNRTLSHATAIAQEFGLTAGTAQSLSELVNYPRGAFDIIVQTTSVGMEHGPDGDPSTGYAFAGAEFLFDVIYTPVETVFLRRGREAGCRTRNGAGMFERQAELQFQRFSRLLGGSPCSDR